MADMAELALANYRERLPEMDTTVPSFRPSCKRTGQIMLSHKEFLVRKHDKKHNPEPGRLELEN